MRTDFEISSLVPSDLVFDGVSDSTDSLILSVRSETAEAECPLSATVSRRIHSRYVRHVADLPSVGRKVHLRLLTRRFSCEVPHCRRRIFAERFGDDVVRFDSGSVGAVAPRETANEQRYSRAAARLRPSLLEIGVTALSASSQQKANLLTRPLH
jgi:transposase